MAVRIKEWEVPYTWWVGIEITANKVINLLLRESNNLIQVNEDNEVYTDLQLLPWIQPNDDFPVGVTTGKILEEDWWIQSGLLLNRKTTSWDYARWIYANDNKLYLDPGTWTWVQIYTSTEINELLEQISAQVVNNWKLTIVENWTIIWEFYANQAWDTTVSIWSPSWLVINTETFFMESSSDTVNWQAAYDWFKQGNCSLLNLKDPSLDWNDVYALADYNANTETLTFKSVRTWTRGWQNRWYTEFVSNIITIVADPITWDVISVTGGESVTDGFISNRWYITPFTPTNDSDPATKKYVDDAVSSGWVPYTWGTWINIDNDHVVSNTLPFDPDNQGTTGQVIKKTENGYEWANESWGWGGTYYGGTWISIDWNNNINNDWVLSVNWNTWVVTVDEFDPDNSGSTGQVLKKTANWYEWSNEGVYAAWNGININNSTISNTWVLSVNNTAPDANWNVNVSWGSYTAWTWININSSDVISNSLPFNPDNSWSTWQVLKKTSNGYEWDNESSSGVTSVNGQTWAVTVDEFDPDNTGSTWQVLTKTANGYEWATNAAEGKVKVWDLSTAPGQSTMAAITLWVAQWDDYSAILNVLDQTYIYWYSDSASWTTNYYFHWLRETTETTTTANGQFTTLSNPAYKISVTSGTYSWTVIYTHTIWNFLTVEDSWYTTPYIPTADYQPATKKYVDDAIAWWGGGWGWITNDTTGTTTTIAKIWGGTETEFNNLSSHATNELYFVL